MVAGIVGVILDDLSCQAVYALFKDEAFGAERQPVEESLHREIRKDFLKQTTRLSGRVHEPLAGRRQRRFAGDGLSQHSWIL